MIFKVAISGVRREASCKRNTNKHIYYSESTINFTYETSLIWQMQLKCFALKVRSDRELWPLPLLFSMLTWEQLCAKNLQQRGDSHSHERAHLFATACGVHDSSVWLVMWPWQPQKLWQQPLVVWKHLKDALQTRCKVCKNTLLWLIFWLTFFFHIKIKIKLWKGAGSTSTLSV